MKQMLKSSCSFATVLMPLISTLFFIQAPAFAVPGIAWKTQNVRAMPLSSCGSEAPLIAMRIKFSKLTMKPVSSDTWYGEAFNNDTGLFIYCVTNRDISCLGVPSTSVMVWATSDRGSGVAQRWVNDVSEVFANKGRGANCGSP